MLCGETSITRRKPPRRPNHFRGPRGIPRGEEAHEGPVLFVHSWVSHKEPDNAGPCYLDTPPSRVPEVSAPRGGGQPPVQSITMHIHAGDSGSHIALRIKAEVKQQAKQAKFEERISSIVEKAITTHGDKSAQAGSRPNPGYLVRTANRVR
uniref:Uncharacterized protein n=1 Tax=Magallana gigas TaxID=29159 RepID=A0A8W8NTE5_MAGGI